MKKGIELVLFDNYGGGDFDYVKAEMIAEREAENGEYKETCDRCGKFIGVSDADVWERIADEESWWWQDMLGEVKRLFGGRDFIACGSVGRWCCVSAGGVVWNGDDFRDWLNVAGSDCIYFEILVEDGILKVKCTHHDGTNYWEIKPLTEKGVSAWEDWENSVRFNNLTEQEMHEKLFNSKHYSQRLKVA